MNILVVGSGGREHALVWKIAQSKRVKKIYCAPGNPGIAQIATLIHIPVDDIHALADFAQTTGIDMTVVGPEIPLVAGIVDEFERRNLRIIGPTKKAAQIEGSKVFAKELMKRYGIPTAKFEVFQEFEKAHTYIQTHEYPLVVKADGLAAGKGVAVCQTLQEAEHFLHEIFQEHKFGTAGSHVVIEEYLEGQEVSFIVVTDGGNFLSLLPSQDHKRIFENDTGPNTGGMGAYAPVPFVDIQLMQQIEQTIIKPVLQAMQTEDCPYKGILYPGIILTKHGPKVLEFNCRFGDPETQPLLSLVESDLTGVFERIINGSVDKLTLKWKEGYAVSVILAAEGYPESAVTGREIKGLEKVYKNVQVFHAGTKLVSGKIVTSGGRVLAVTGTGSTLQHARDSVYAAIGNDGIYFDGMQYRKDIGEKGIR